MRKETAKVRFQRARPYLVCTFILISAMAMITSIRNNPSLAESRNRENMMRGDLRALLALGGSPVTLKANYKYGGAYVIQRMANEGWSDNLIQGFDAELAALGWVKVASSTREYCKEGAIAKIDSNAGMDGNQSFNNISMEYNAGTIKFCLAQLHQPPSN